MYNLYSLTSLKFQLITNIGQGCDSTNRFYPIGFEIIFVTVIFLASRRIQALDSEFVRNSFTSISIASRAKGSSSIIIQFIMSSVNIRYNLSRLLLSPACNVLEIIVPIYVLYSLIPTLPLHSFSGRLRVLNSHTEILNFCPTP
jgi:hypothetical protein